ncbi:MAG: hypothetical protein ACFB21_00550, partial [Opitutales bacterium]
EYAGQVPSERLSETSILAGPEILLKGESWEALPGWLDVLRLRKTDEVRRTRLEAYAAYQDNRYEEAFEWVKAWLTQAPENAEANFLAGHLMLRESGVFNQLRVIEYWFRAAEDEGEYGLAALNALSNLGTPFMERAELERVAGAILERPDATPGNRLQARLIEMALEPERRDEILANAIEQWSQREPALLAQWLNVLGEFQHTLSLVGPYPLENHPALRLPAIRAHLGSDNPALALELLERYPDTVSPTTLAVATLQLKLNSASFDDPQIQADFDTAQQLITSEQDANAAWALAKAAEAAGDFTRACAAYDTIDLDAFGQPQVEMRFTRHRFRALMLSGELEEAHRYAVEHKAAITADAMWANDFAYLSLLLEKDLEDSRELLQQLSNASPNNSFVQSSRAFALWQEGRPGEAHRLLQNLPADLVSGTPSIQLLKALVLQDLGDSARAYQEVRQVPPEALLGPEQELHNTLLATLDQGQN